ncbi:putative quinol monooxygenase [Flavobacterium sp. '19STA2R22 D10 B1']|uniref:putative quinol monooxygenase n=1 Tax=Flavobacterium aerium TaxID=3037261 RepID=UPI00278BBA80|nr:putative quinol monooxygenase [Flavobacterium sp. '19STA2R22 D10 B1']
MSKKPTLAIIAEFIVELHNQSKVLELLVELRQKSLTEEGCLQYDIHTAANDPLTIVLYESYTDLDAVQAHRDSTHYKEIGGKHLAPLLLQRTITEFNIYNH